MLDITEIEVPAILEKAVDERALVALMAASIYPYVCQLDRNASINDEKLAVNLARGLLEEVDHQLIGVSSTGGSA